jgi:hypothetical protein
MNPFKTLNKERGVSSVVKKKDLEYVNETANFPVLSGTTGSREHVNVLDYKRATTSETVREKVVDVDYVAPGWVKYVVDKKTNRMVETKGSSTEPEIVLDPEEKEELMFDELMSALNTNWERNRKMFISCHGEEYYNDIFLMEHYDEMHSDDEQ